MSRNQLFRIQLQLSYALTRRREVETYLQLTQQSLNILDSHVTQLKEDNAAQIHLLEGEVVPICCRFFSYSLLFRDY